MKKEKERKNWRENLVTSLEVPGDLAMKETIITLTGRNHAVVSAGGDRCAGISWKGSHPGEKTYDSEIYIRGNADRGNDFRNCNGIIVIESQEAVMKDLTGFRKGTVRIRVQGEQTERFLNLCKAREIKISRLIRTGDQSLEGNILIADFFRLSPIHRKTCVKIHILEKHGLPFFFYRSKKRKAFFIGIFACALILFGLSGRVWEIDVSGNARNSTQEILDFLKEEGIVHGIQRSKISCSAIATTIRENYNDITWVSARIEGTCLVITVKEGIFTDAVEKEENTPCNLTADQNGVIVRMITRAGYPKMHVGEECHIGDVLVSGCLELKNDSQEVVRYEGVHADADIYIKRKKAYYREIPLEYQAEEYDGRERKSYFFKTGNTYLELGGSAENNWQNTMEEKILRLTDSFRLPFTVGKITRKHYETVSREYTEKEVRALAWSTLQL